MPEHVTQYAQTKTGDATRLNASLDRFAGDRTEVRGHDRRDAEAMFQWLVAAKGRLPVGRIYRHVCRHDEGVMDCRTAVVEG
jgi:hypothetical protein